MNYSKQQSKFTHPRSSRMMSLLLGSILPSSILSASVVLAKSTPAQVNAGQGSAASSRVAQTDPAAPPKPAVPAATPASVGLNDVSGNWAEPFIRVLVTKGIIKGYPDGSFKPNQLVTRAEFTALLNKAFSLQPTREAKVFSDIPNKYWATEVIQKAYQGGFLSGYPDGTFAPDRNILRIESLVSLIDGNKLTSTGTVELDGLFTDAAQIPSYGKNAIAAATQKCVAIGVDTDYDSGKIPGGTFKPNQGATRADVAAIIHQVLVSTGRLTALEKTSPANKYIASCPDGEYNAIVAGDPTPPAVVEPVQPPPVAETPDPGFNPYANFSAPANSVNIPSAFGANWGDIFAGFGYQNTTRPQILADPTSRVQGGRDGAVAFGFGLGNSRSSIAGLEVAVVSNSSIRRGIFKEGTINLKLHKQFGNNFAIAAGSDNAIIYGTGSDVGPSYYGVTGFVLNPSPRLDFLSNTTLTLGIGNGQYRNIGDIRTNASTIGVIGGVATRITPNISLAVDWDAKDLSVGLPISFQLGDRFGIGITPVLVDLVNPETGGRRFVLSGGIGYSF